MKTMSANLDTAAMLASDGFAILPSSHVMPNSHD